MAAPLPLVIMVALFVGTATNEATPMRATKPEKFPRPQEEPLKPGTEMPAPGKRQRIFGIGVGFERSGTLAGVALNIVLPDSPAARAGLMPGCIISEINGELTAGRIGEDCARLIRDGATKVRIKYLDPALKERVLVLEKEWLAIPE
ncbi:MAG: PDZ domain-containing protein [Chthoniobacteraceae bacterium]